MKRVCCWLLILALFVGAAPAAWAINTPSFVVGQTEYPFSEDASGAGWRYHAETVTLTLDGLRYPSDDWENYLDFSEASSEFHLVLEAGSENAVGMISLTDQTVISGGGSLEVNTIYGSITMKSGTLSGGCIYGGNLTVDGGAVILERTKALNLVTVNCGSLTVGGLDTYSLVQHGGTIRAGFLSNCNGTAVSHMRYCLSGGNLILENTDPNNSQGAFLCASYETSPRLLEQALRGFSGSLVGADGQQLELRYTGYTQDEQMVGDLTGADGRYYSYLAANLYNRDGTIAKYAAFRPAAACTHSGDKRCRRDEETHWQACVDCGADLPDTKEAHRHLAFGEKKLCICGDALAGDGSVETQAAELALYFWGTGKPMQYALHKVLDQNGDDVITLPEVALVQLAAEGKAIPEDLAVVSMAYQANGRAKQAISKQGELSGDWHTAKLYILEGETSAPLVQPICVSWR